MSKTFWDRFAGFYDLAEWTDRRAVRGMAAELVGLPLTELAIIPGRIPVGLAVFRKPGRDKS